MSDLVGNPEDRFSQNEAHLFLFKCIIEIRVDGGGSWDMVVSLLHRVNDCQNMYINIVLLLYINWMNVYEEILDSTMLNV